MTDSATRLRAILVARLAQYHGTDAVCIDKLMGDLSGWTPPPPTQEERDAARVEQIRRQPCPKVIDDLWYARCELLAILDRRAGAK